VSETLERHYPSPQSERERRIAELGPWFHNLHLPDGLRTAPRHPLGDFPSYKWRAIAPVLPEDLSGWEVLDVGCNAGFYTFELARRGARVTGVDIDPRYLRQARWAAEELGLAERVRFERRTVYDLGRDGRRYDLVWFMGVLYHLRYPLLALDLLSAKVGRLLVLQTLTKPATGSPRPLPENLELDQRDELVTPGWPSMAFLEGRLAGDPTNWWAPDGPAVEAMLRSCGLRVVSRPAEETWLAEPDPGADDHAAGQRRRELAAVLGTPRSVTHLEPGKELPP
jgi:tRNA (mo5U34)-methyltransferase